MYTETAIHGPEEPMCMTCAWKAEPQDVRLARQIMREAGPGLCFDDALALARYRLYGDRSHDDI